MNNLRQKFRRASTMPTATDVSVTAGSPPASSSVRAEPGALSVSTSGNGRTPAAALSTDRDPSSSSGRWKQRGHSLTPGTAAGASADRRRQLQPRQQQQQQTGARFFRTAVKKKTPTTIFVDDQIDGQNGGNMSNIENDRKNAVSKKMYLCICLID